LKVRRKKKSGLSSLIELVVIVAVALGLALAIQAFLIKPYRIPSGSMEPTLAVGQRVLVNRIGNDFGPPEVGDIVVFNPPTGAQNNECGADQKPGEPCQLPTKQQWDTNFIKRVVAGPGQKIGIVDGRVYIDGKRQNEPFIRPCGGGQACNFPRPIPVPADHYFMMGDNRGASDDSRFWGPVPQDWIIGDAFATYWPLDRIGLF
jgi:signal peptidase I